MSSNDTSSNLNIWVKAIECLSVNASEFPADNSEGV